MSALAFAIFGALLASSISGDAAAIPVGALSAALAGWLAMWLLRWPLAMTAGAAREADGRAGYLLPWATLES